MLQKKSMILVISACVTLMLLSLTNTATAASWRPNGPIKLMIAFRAGGGVDTQARLIAEELQNRHGWKIIPTQVVGKGGINLAKALAKSPNDGSVIGMTVSETFGYNLAATRKSGLKIDDFTPLITTAIGQTGIVALTSSGWTNFHEVIRDAKQGRKIRFGAMAQNVADLAYLLGKANGVEFNIVSVKGGKAVLNGLNAGDIDVGFVAGPQAKAVEAGTMVNLACAISEPLILSPNAPMLSEFGVQFTSDVYFMFVAPAGIPSQARQVISDAIEEIIVDQSTKAGQLITKVFGQPTVVKGAELDAVIKNSYREAGNLLAAVME